MQRSKRIQSPHSPTTSKANSSPPKKLYRSAGQSAGYTSPSTVSPSLKKPSLSASNPPTRNKMLGENRFSTNPTVPSPHHQTTNLPPFSLPPHHHHHHYKTTGAPTLVDENDRSSVSDNDSVNSPQGRGDAPISLHSSGGADDKPKPAPGKKTRGRVKIEMQYIQNKLRRYTTFSKRKSGIMKKVKSMLYIIASTSYVVLLISLKNH